MSSWLEMTLQVSWAVYLSIVCKPALVKMLRLLSLRCRFVPSKFCFGLQSAWSNHLFMHLFFCHTLPPILQSNSTTSIWVRHILRLSAPAQKNPAYAIKNIRTLWSFTKILHPNFPEPYRVYTCTGTSPAICIETLWNLTRYLHRTPPEPQQVSPPEPSGTLRNLARNLVLKLHRIAPELFWAKDPIANFCCWGKKDSHQSISMPFTQITQCHSK